MTLTLHEPLSGEYSGSLDGALEIPRGARTVRAGYASFWRVEVVYSSRNESLAAAAAEGELRPP